MLDQYPLLNEFLRLAPVMALAWYFGGVEIRLRSIERERKRRRKTDTDGS